ncbi:MAG: indole-3-glycerol-phosphate synthase [Leptospira sp.]|nr:indole-3-glycerol-phosphate synthase [Leptospira sp.]
MGFFTNPVLQKIVSQKKSEVADIRTSDFPVRKHGVFPFATNLKKKDSLAVIAECKKGSPSAGILRDKYDPLAISKIYERMGAGAISILTDREFFFGSLQHLQSVAQSVQIPVIRKDFIIDELQIDEAYAYGASAILLIVRILTPNRLKELYTYAKKLGLEVLVETHTQEEVLTSIELDFEVIGINTRDLDTFEIHNELIFDLSKLIPKSKVIVGESGVSKETNLVQYKGVVDSFLIGTYFMKSEDIESAYRSLVLG